MSHVLLFKNRENESFCSRTRQLLLINLGGFHIIMTSYVTVINTITIHVLLMPITMMHIQSNRSSRVVYNKWMCGFQWFSQTCGWHWFVCRGYVWSSPARRQCGPHVFPTHISAVHGTEGRRQILVRKSQWSDGIYTW